MSDSAMTGGDPETVDMMGHQTAKNDPVIGEPVYNTNDAEDPRNAEILEEQHLDDRHATGEHYTPGVDPDVDAPEGDPMINLDDENR